MQYMYSVYNLVYNEVHYSVPCTYWHNRRFITGFLILEAASGASNLHFGLIILDKVMAGARKGAMEIVISLNFC